MNFKEIFDKATDKTKLDFLFAILEHNEKLKDEFANYVETQGESDKTPAYEMFVSIVKKHEQECREELETIDVENPDWDSYTPSHSGYIEEWKQYQEAAEQEIEAIYRFWQNSLIDTIIGQKIETGLAMLIGAYEASLNSEINDTIDSLGDPNEFFVEQHKELMKYYIEKIEQAAINNHSISGSFSLFLEYCEKEYPGNESYPRYFEPVLLALAEKSGNPETILHLLKDSKVENKFLPQLVLLLNKLCGKSDNWLKSAKAYYLSDNKVAEELLKYYLEKDIVVFTMTAKELFYKDKYHWAIFLQDKVNEVVDEKLYKDVFFELTVKDNKIVFYQKIKNLLSTAEKQELLEKHIYSKPFIVKILEDENRYSDIKQLVTDNIDSWDFNKLISPILEEYPDFCFETIKNKALKTITTQRGRVAYERIAEWIKLAKLIPAYENLTRELIIKLYNNKPNLPALKDEFKIAGLV